MLLSWHPDECVLLSLSYSVRFWVGRYRRARVSRSWAEAGGDRKIPGFLNRVLSVRDPHVGGAVEAGTLWETVGVWVELEAAPEMLRRRRPPRCVGGWRSPGPGQTAEWSQKRSRTWPARERHIATRQSHVFFGPGLAFLHGHTLMFRFHVMSRSRKKLVLLKFPSTENTIVQKRSKEKRSEHDA